jgi:hypothetical protein
MAIAEHDTVDVGFLEERIALSRHHRRRRLDLGCVGIAVGLWALAPSPASAIILRCGQTITRSTTLTKGLGPCPGSGVVIGANNITLDLGGHTIRSQSFPSSGPPPPSPGAGVLIGDHHGVTVRDGTITGYVTWAPFRGIFVTRDGIEVGGPAPPGGPGKPKVAGHNRVLAITTSNVVQVIGDDNLIASERSGPTEAFVRVEGQRNRITLSGRVRDCASGLLGPGLSLEVDGSHNVVDHNRACRIAVAFFLGSGGNANTVEDNTVVGGPIESSGGEIGPGGRYVTISGERIIGNHVRDRPIFGGEISGIYLFDTSASLVDANELLYSGISLAQSFSDIGLFGPLYPLIDHNRLINNRVAQVRKLNGGGSASQGDGIDIPGPSPNGASMYPGARKTLLEGNTTDNNAHDGINNGAPTTTFHANVANNNGSLGIESVAGVTDLGGDRASGNGKRAQCTHVRCR